MFLVPKELMQAVHDYLLSRPMREVEPLVSSLRECAEAQQKAEELDADQH